MVQQLNTQHQLLKAELETVVPELHEATAEIVELKKENQRVNMKIAALHSQQGLQMSESF